jgi:hypothetical protein
VGDDLVRIVALEFKWETSSPWFTVRGQFPVWRFATVIGNGVTSDLPTNQKEALGGLYNGSGQ